MKTLKKIFKMSQPELKKYMKSYLTSKEYTPIDEEGYLYAKGDVPVLLVAHLDTVHKLACTCIVEKDNRISSPQGIGGDDRCGVYIIMKLLERFKCSVLLCEDEEIGCVGAHKFAKSEYINKLDVNYMIEFDRKGNNDAVFYSCDNKDFTDFVIKATGFKKASGSCSDISVLMPAAELSAVNLSCGYYNAHTTEEYVVYEEMMDTVEASSDLIESECTEPFKYIKMKYEYYPSFSRNRNYDLEYYDNLFHDYRPCKNKNLASYAKDDTKIELEAIVTSSDVLGLDGYDDNEEALYATGDTKAECWMQLFMDNPDICFNDIVDYSWN